MPAQTPTTSFTSTTLWGCSCWILTTGSLDCCRVSGITAKTFPWRCAQSLIHHTLKLQTPLCNILYTVFADLALLLHICKFQHFNLIPLTYIICPSQSVSSLQKYVKPIFTEESYLELQRRQKKSFNTQQLTAFRLLFAWRDKLARQEDESTG